MSGTKKFSPRKWFTIQGVAWSPDAKRDLVYRQQVRHRPHALRDHSGWQGADHGSPARRVDVSRYRKGWQGVAGARQLAARVDGLFGNDGKQHELSWLDYTYPAELSADGKTLLFDEEGGGGSLALFQIERATRTRVYIRKTDGSPAVLLGEGGALALSPDGKWAIAETQDSPSQFKLLPTGAGQSQRSHA